MNPYGTPGSDIFSSNINQSANSFSDPLNIAHLYPGWGVNTNYQTPSYDANYRPAYQGPNPYASYQKPGFLGALSQLYSPTFKDPYWGNPVDNNSNAFNAIGTRPMDAMAHVGQNYMIPLAAFAITSSKLFAGVNGVASRVTGGLTSGMMRGVGLGGMDMGMGKGLGWAAGKLGMSGVESSLVGRGAVGAFGAALGGVLAPLALGWAASEAADAAVFQPYIRSRQMTQTIQDSFAGVTFGGSGGNRISGRGLSGRESSSMATEIDRMGIRDMTFSANQYHGIAAMGMRAGLFDDVDSGGITKRVSSIASQIKLIVAISKDPNIQSAIEELGKLRAGGASLSGGAGSVAAGAFSSLGMYASAAGTSVQRLMGTVGNQGQYMFQMNGITPYLGQLSAATAFSGFASAQRSGLLSSAQLARMGGIEGATQSAVAGQLTAAMTPYNRMQLANQFLGGTTGGGMMGTISSFGQLSAQDPFKLMGAMALHGNGMLSQQFKNGGKVAENQAIDLLQSIGKRPGADGKFDPNDVAQAMVSMGMPPDQIQAYVSMRAAQTDPDVILQNIRGFKAQKKETLQQAISQYGIYGGGLNSGFVNPIRRGIKDAIETGAEIFAYGPARGAARLGDKIAENWNHMFFDSSISNDSTDGLDMGKIEAAFRKPGDNDGKTPYWAGGSQEGHVSNPHAKTAGGSQEGHVSNPHAKTVAIWEAAGGYYKGSTVLKNTDKYAVVSRLDTVARSGGKGANEARKLLSLGFSDPSAKKLFADFLRTQDGPEFERMYRGLDKSGDLFYDAGAMVRVGSKTTSGDDNAANSAALDALTGIKADIFDNLKLVGQAGEIFGGGGMLGLDLEDTLGDAKYAELRGALANVDPAEKAGVIAKMATGRIHGFTVSSNAAAHMESDPAAVYRDPARFSSDPKIQQEIRDSNGDTSKIKAAMLKEVNRRSGGRTKGTDLKLDLSKDISQARDQVRAVEAPLLAAGNAIAKGAEDATSGVDWKSFSSAATKIDSGATVFLAAVNKFVEFEERKTGPLKLSIPTTNARSSGETK